MGTLTARPWAFLIVLAYAGAWLILEPETLEMHGIATLIVWTMTLFIQRAEHRDTQAMHAKLDELLKAQGNARSSLSKIDDAEAEEIEAHRGNEARKQDSSRSG